MAPMALMHIPIPTTGCWLRTMAGKHANGKPVSTAVTAADVADCTYNNAIERALYLWVMEMQDQFVLMCVGLCLHYIICFWRQHSYLKTFLALDISV